MSGEDRDKKIVVAVRLDGKIGERTKENNKYVKTTAYETATVGSGMPSAMITIIKRSLLCSILEASIMLDIHPSLLCLVFLRGSRMGSCYY